MCRDKIKMFKAKTGSKQNEKCLKKKKKRNFYKAINYLMFQRFTGVSQLYVTSLTNLNRFSCVGESEWCILGHLQTR